MTELCSTSYQRSLFFPVLFADIGAIKHLLRKVCVHMCVCVCREKSKSYLLAVLGGNSRFYLLANMTGTLVPCDRAVFVLAIVSC